ARGRAAACQDRGRVRAGAGAHPPAVRGRAGQGDGRASDAVAAAPDQRAAGDGEARRPLRHRAAGSRAVIAVRGRWSAAEGVSPLRRCAISTSLFRHPTGPVITMERNVERRLTELGITLPRPPRAIGNFAYGIEHQGMLYLSGTYGTAVNAEDEDFLPIAGKLGAELAIEDGYRSARLMAINHLAMAKAVLGDLDRVVRVIRLLGFVNAAPGFRDAPKVLNGASDLLVAGFGPERGRHARASLD